MDIVARVANRYASYFGVGDVVLYGKWKNHKGKILSFGNDLHGNPTVTIEPIPKGRKDNKTFGLFKIWRAENKNVVVPVKTAASKKAIEDACAEAAHEANRQLCESLGDKTQKGWADAEDWQKDATYANVRRVMSGDFDERASHEHWMEDRLEDGWKLGPKKDEDKKTHPSLVPYDKLPFEEQAKDRLFVTTVRAVASKMGWEFPKKKKTSKTADLHPPLGRPGGPCQVVKRIDKTVRNPGQKKDLIEDVEHGTALSNPDASKIYPIETEQGSGIIGKIEITSHAQYRMDLRSVGVEDVRRALASFSNQLLAWKAQSSKAFTHFAGMLERGEKVEWVDPKTRLDVVFQHVAGDTVRLITTYWKGVRDPAPAGDCRL